MEVTAITFFLKDLCYAKKIIDVANILGMAVSVSTFATTMKVTLSKTF
jgi:hypothetical protein